MPSKWIKGNVSRPILVLDTSLFIHFDDKYFQTEGVENRVGDDGVRAILQYRPSDLYLMDMKETGNFAKIYPHVSPCSQIRPSLVQPFLSQDKLLIQMHLDVPCNARAAS